MTRAKSRLTLSLARRRMGYGEGGPSWRGMEPSRFLRDLPPELFGEAVAREVRAREAPAAARPPVIRRHPGALEGEPHIELDGEDGFAGGGGSQPHPARRPASAPEPSVDYSFDQRPDAGRAPFSRGDRVLHGTLGEGIVLACEAGGADAKATVRFGIGDKRVLARFLRRG
jgi:DNA helicase-2/ATP-dependent DNA helicase PcrA